jgi:hypothetical protein
MDARSAFDARPRYSSQVDPTFDLKESEGTAMRAWIVRRLLPACMLTAVSCVGFALERSRVSHPESASIEVDAHVTALKRGYYLATVSLRNTSAETLKLDRSMFALTAPDPVSFVMANRVGFGRQAFRLPPTVAPGAFANGEIYFGIRGASRPTEPVTLRIVLPDGEHRFEFTVVD